MIKSMTGFGRGEYTDGKRNIMVEIRSVNHRYCDIIVKMPRKYSFAEEKIKSAVKEIIRRGKVEVSVMVDDISDDDINVRLNTGLARRYYDNLILLKESLELEETPTLSMLVSLPDVMKSIPDIEDEEEVSQHLLHSTSLAVNNLDEMRCKEGAKLAEDLIQRAGYIRKMTEEIEKIAPEMVKMYGIKLQERIEELLGKSIEIPEERIIMEATIYADKASITEELVRLDSHMLQLVDIIEKSKEADGKRLDFLIQEMNREANTIGSKANNIDITNLILQIKSEVEKIREQVQNIE
ncbi:MAG: YicC/YloC family endoribonuclease [Anaerovoracaceae bacterium]|jgi:uncharacterized protein (TIGR00255 family)|nr:YicC/YloC family endoribonuclease [Anaerovoracaceae bacterium]